MVSTYYRRLSPSYSKKNYKLIIFYIISFSKAMIPTYLHHTNVSTDTHDFEDRNLMSCDDNDNIEIEIRKFVCPQCGNRYKHMKNLNRHLRLECGKEPQFPCPFCDFKCKRNNHLRSHIRNKHVVKDNLE